MDVDIYSPGLAERDSMVLKPKMKYDVQYFPLKQHSFIFPARYRMRAVLGLSKLIGCQDAKSEWVEFVSCDSKRD